MGSSSSKPSPEELNAFVNVSGSSKANMPLNEVCGKSPNGIPAYSNYLSTIQSSSKHIVDGLFMGRRWQCVEYARRWLWLTKGLWLPTRISAFRYKGLSSVYRPTGKDGQQLQPSAIQATTSPDADLSEETSGITWKKVPCTFVYQGTTTPPITDSLIIYPFTRRNMTGHIGVITAVDLEAKTVGVSDQNRYFKPWVDADGNALTHSATFQLDCIKGKHFIRDKEDECVGWITFPGFPNLPQPTV